MTKRSAHNEMLTGKSIRGQLSHVHQHNGLVIYTFWYDNRVTRIDGWGHKKEYDSSSQEEQQRFYELKVSQGYDVVTEYVVHDNHFSTYRAQLLGLM